MKTLIEIALMEWGIKEISGSQQNRRIIDYASEAGIRLVNNNETPWCSIFLNWCAKQAGLQSSGKANAMLVFTSTRPMVM